MEANWAERHAHETPSSSWLVRISVGGPKATGTRSERRRSSPPTVKVASCPQTGSSLSRLQARTRPARPLCGSSFQLEAVGHPGQPGSPWYTNQPAGTRSREDEPPISAWHDPRGEHSGPRVGRLAVSRAQAIAFPTDGASRLTEVCCLLGVHSHLGSLGVGEPAASGHGATWRNGLGVTSVSRSRERGTGPPGTALPDPRRPEDYRWTRGPGILEFLFCTPKHSPTLEHICSSPLALPLKHQAICPLTCPLTPSSLDAPSPGPVLSTAWAMFVVSALRALATCVCKSEGGRGQALAAPPSCQSVTVTAEGRAPFLCQTTCVY